MRFERKAFILAGFLRFMSEPKIIEIQKSRERKHYVLTVEFW